MIMQYVTVNAWDNQQTTKTKNKLLHQPTNQPYGDGHNRNEVWRMPPVDKLQWRRGFVLSIELLKYLREM